MTPGPTRSAPSHSSAPVPVLSPRATTAAVSGVRTACRSRKEGRAHFGSNTSAIGLVSATSVGAGSWRDDGLVIRTTSANNYNAIDPNLVNDLRWDASGWPQY